MTLTIDLPPEIEATLTRRAAARGLSLRDYVFGLLEGDAVAPAKKPRLTVEERLALWRNFAKDFPRSEPLSDKAISRESLYDTRG